MLEDHFPLDLTADELFTLIHILDEWMAENPNLVGPPVDFVDGLYDKIHSMPYPTAAADRYQSLIADFEAERLSKKQSQQIISLYRCPHCGSPIELGPEKIGGFCFICLVGIPIQELKKLVSR